MPKRFPRSNTKPTRKWPNAKSAGSLEIASVKYPCLAAKVIHRIGIIPVGETAIYVGIASPHRAEAIALLDEFMDRLKQDVPIWKRRALPLNPWQTTQGVSLLPKSSQRLAHVGSDNRKTAFAR